VQVQGSEDRQPWLLIGTAIVALLLGGLGLIVAMDAKSASDDAATQQEVDRIDEELSNLLDKLGIAEASLSGEESKLQGRARRAAKQSQKAAVNLSDRLERLERQTAALNASAKRTAKLSGEVSSLRRRVKAIDAEIIYLNQRIAKLSKRVSDASASSDGGKSAP
jgi:predicted  nucleic acid-binding Zn-ribbon protein